MSQKRKINIKNYLDALVDKDGLKTEVTITMTTPTTVKLIAALLGSGLTIMLVYSLLKNYFPNAQLIAIQKQLKEIQ